MTRHTSRKDPLSAIVPQIRNMSFFRPTSDPSRRDGREESVPSTILHEAILASSSSVRDSLPEQHRAHFETLRQEIIDFAQAHNIPRESLSKPDALREAAKKLSTPDLQRLANLLERFEYLLVKKEPWKNEEALEYTEEFYHLEKQYAFQVSLLEQVGILKEGAILGIDGNKYPVPTLEQIAVRLFERRKELKTKHDQGFTKLLLVPFGMSLDSLRETLKQFLLKHQESNPSFNLDTNEPLSVWEGYQGADMGDSPKLVYYPQSFTEEGHEGKTKMEILEGQAEGRWTLPPTAGAAPGGTASAGVARGGGVGVAEESGTGTPGWTVHLFQPSNPKDSDSPGFASIPKEGQGTPQGDIISRPPLEANKTPVEYLFTLQEAQDDPDSPYSQESGMTPEDWILAFILHLQETGKPMDNWQNDNESISYLTGAFFPSSVGVPGAYWNRSSRWTRFGCWNVPYNRVGSFGTRTSVIV